MARVKRVCPAGDVFQVLNRAVARLTIFEKPEDYAAFMRVLDETWQIVPLPIFAMVASLGGGSGSSGSKFNLAVV